MISIRQISRAIRSTLILWVITAVIYPLFILIFGQVVFPFQANGSLIKNNEAVVIGSILIGQPFSGDRYFWNRPSVVNYSGVSGASNLAPSNQELINNISKQIQQLKAANIKPNSDLVYTSGSGLDPHISIESARNQIERVAKARNLDVNQVEIMMNKAIEGRFLGIFGEPGVNVLKLNLALDKN